MTRLDFIATAADAPAPAGDLAIVVLDPTWTPLPDERKDLLPVRSLVARSVTRIDLFDDALERLDAWAMETAITDRLLIDDVTWWPRLRETMWRWLHERLLWWHLLDELGIDPPSSISLPEDRPALRDVVGLRWPDAEIRMVPTPEPRPPSPAADESLVLRLARRALLRVRGGRGRGLEERERRRWIVERRIARLGSTIDGGRPRVLVLTNPNTYQLIGGAGARPTDPLFGAVIPALDSIGVEVVLFANYQDEARDESWPWVRDEPRAIPESMLRSRWASSDDADRRSATVSQVRAGVLATGQVPIRLGEADLRPQFVDALETATIGVAMVDRPVLDRVRRMLDELRPGAILLAQEGIRTPWLVAAGAAGIPLFAVQHGVLYRGHAGYSMRSHPKLVLPTTTFVYGDFEGDVLRSGAYDADQVEAVGSPRLDLDVPPVDAAAAAADRAAVREELGVGDGDRLLVVSTVNLKFVQESHFLVMLERTLGGPLPGVHVVFKLHPGEFDDGPYEALLAGLARAGGYAPPRVTTVKAIDLYRLLRAADAHLGMLSTVVTEAAAVGTLNLIAMGDAHADLLGYVEAGVARPVWSAADVLAALDDPRPVDPAALAAFLGRHFRPGNASLRIAERVAEAARSRLRVPVA